MSDAGVQTRGEPVRSHTERAAALFSKGGIDSPRLTAELLMCDVLGCLRIDLSRNITRVLTDEESRAFQSHVARRLAHEPLQYIVGSTEFMGLRFEVDRSTLIPRPETEHLVSEVIASARESGLHHTRILDIGTGSGNIAISLARLLPGARVTGVDVSKASLSVAARNAAALGATDRVELIELDLHRLDKRFSGGEFDYVVSNPPYIPHEEIRSLAPEIRDYEPIGALAAGRKGLEFFYPIANAGRRLLRDGGWIFFEIAYGQHDDVGEILSSAGYEDVEFTKDLGGILRVARGRVPSAA